MSNALRALDTKMKQSKSHLRRDDPEIMSISHIHVLLLSSSISLIVSLTLPSWSPVLVLKLPNSITTVTVTCKTNISNHYQSHYPQHPLLSTRMTPPLNCEQLRCYDPHWFEQCWMPSDRLSHHRVPPAWQEGQEAKVPRADLWVACCVLCSKTDHPRILWCVDSTGDPPSTSPFPSLPLLKCSCDLLTGRIRRRR